MLRNINLPTLNKTPEENFKAIQRYLFRYDEQLKYVLNNLSFDNFSDTKINNSEILTDDTAKKSYADINFANIGSAAMEHLYVESGLIVDATIKNGVITGELKGVTISGDLIKANTLVADKLVVKGKDGLYYRLNAELDGITQEQLDTEEYQSALHGSNIIAKSITADHIKVTDLEAFGATIGGFKISKTDIHSGEKISADSTAKGIYIDSAGQIGFGGDTDYIRYYKTENGNYKLEISVEDVSIGTNRASALDLGKTATNFIYYTSAGGVQVGNKSSGSWSGTRSQMTADAYNILDAAGNVLASYGANEINLGENSESSVINLCSGKGAIKYHTVQYSSNTDLEISSGNIAIVGDTRAGICAFDGANELFSCIDVYTDRIEMGIGDFVNANGEKWLGDTAIYLTKGNINLTAEAVDVNGYMTVSAGIYSKEVTVGSIGNGIVYDSGAHIWSSQEEHLYLNSWNGLSGTVHIGYIDNMRALNPMNNGQVALGTPNSKWGQIYSTASSISTSDRNEKNTITLLDDKAKDLIMNIQPVSFKFNDGTSNRTHWGLIAQDVKESMDKIGISELEFAGYCCDQKRDENDMPIEDKYIYGLRYEEFIAPLIKVVQMHQKELQEIKDTLKQGG